MEYQEINGDLIQLALEGKFDVIAHGCNCFCNMGAGIARIMAETFNCDGFEFEGIDHDGNMNKLGNLDYECLQIVDGKVVPIDEKHLLAPELVVVNAYTQYQPGPHLNYQALSLCLSKMNHLFAGSHIGLPQIGCGIAGGDWDKVSTLIKWKLTDCKVTVVIYEPKMEEYVSINEAIIHT